jgi:hypothetical protein
VDPTSPCRALGVRVMEYGAFVAVGVTRDPTVVEPRALRVV